MRGTRTSVGVVTALALAMGWLAACGGDDDDTGGGNVTIEVSNLPPETEASVREAFMKRVEEFEKANPDIDVKPVEWEWEAATFSSQLAGGTLPTTFEFPFTDGQALIERGQMADISEAVKELPYAGDFNQSVLDVVEAEDGKIYGLPKDAYGMGLHYNRAMFEQAGLDPDKPPTSWDEVRDYAKKISDATGQAGYASMTSDNTGGWILTTLTYALGGRMEEGSGDDVEATLDNPQTKEVLEMLDAMRWEDDSMGDNFLFDWAGINQAFAAGQVGMYVGGSDVYNSLVTENHVNPDEYGLTVLPLDGDDSGVLGGGTIVGVSPKASDEEKTAAVKWIDHYYMSKWTDQDAAVADAEATAASEAPLGTPVLPVFDQEQQEAYDTWIADMVNVPIEQMATFKEAIVEQELVPEPPVMAQELYAELDAVVQAVLSEENADIDSLLEKADENVQSSLESG